jgi:uncharacterized repeat protein (TIGR01451 family)
MKRALPTLLALFGILQLQAQTVILNVTHATCGNSTGSIVASAFGGVAPYTFMWAPDPPTGQGTSFLSDILPGEYTVTITDANGNSASATDEVLLIPGLFQDVTPTNPVWSCDATCSGSFYQFIPLSGGSMPYTATFDPPGPTGGASPNGLYFNDLCPGTTYTVTITDVNGCSGVVGPLEVVGDMAPQLLATNATASCASGNTGSLELLFANMDSVIVVGPGGMIDVASANPWVANNLEPGTYSISAWYGTGNSTPPGGTGPSCSTDFTVEVPLSTDPCGQVGGVVFADLNEDCLQDLPDLGLPYRVIQITPGNNFQLTDGNGNYATELFYGDYALDASFEGYQSNCVTLPAAFTLDAATPSATIDLPMEVLFGPDVRSFLNAGVHRPGFPVTYTPSVHNEGPYAFADITFDPILNFVSATGSPILVAAGHLQWNIVALGGFSSQSFTVEFTVPPQASLLGVVLSGNAAVIPQSPDADPGNDSYGITRTVIGAYDPNDKLAQTDFTQNDQIFFIDLDSYVDYTIRFQNTGTAEAINVFLLDTIAAEYDLSTLRVLGASHDFEASLLPGRVLRFDFPNIMLPDSTSDLLGSQGFASFRLWPFPGMEPGDHLLNAADIFFDFNEPIRTNTSDLVAEYSVGLAETVQTNVRVFPNPVRDMLNVQVPKGNWNIEVFGMDGRTALSGRSNGELLGVDARVLAPGSYVLRLIDGTGTVLNARFVKE